MRIYSQIYKMLAALLFCSAMTACTSIYDNMSECPTGQYFRYVYDKTMSGGDAFGAQVGFASLYVYDENGTYVTTFTGQGGELDNNGYRMHTYLPAGKYRLISWCLAEPAETSFSLSDCNVSATFTNTLNTDENNVSKDNLSPLWHGSEALLEVTDEGNEYTIRLTKNTNNIRIVLQQIDGNEVRPESFDFAITGVSRIIYGEDNHTSGDVIYKPFATGQSTVGGDADGNGRITIAYAEFGTSRLMAGSNARLRIDRRDDGLNVLDIPLIDYLSMRSEIYSSWSDQEYLDRESSYTMVLFLDKDHQWVKTTIIVNGWTVRINDADL